MLDSVFIDIAIGLALTFFVVSSMVATLNEVVTRVLDIRAKVLWGALANTLSAPGDDDTGPTSKSFQIRLLDSLRALAFGFDQRPVADPTSLDDPDRALVERLASSPLVTSLGGVTRMTTAGMSAGRTKVDRIPARIFSSVLLDLSRRGSRSELVHQLAEAREAHRRAIRPNPDPAHVVAGWDAAHDPTVITDAVEAAGLDPALAEPLVASAAAWGAATTDGNAVPGAVALNQRFGRGINEVSATMDVRILTDLQQLVAGTPIGTVVDNAVGLTRREIDYVLDDLNQWFDTYMARLTELYRIAARQVLFVAGLVLAVALNVSAIDLVGDLRADADLRASLTAAADAVSACADDELDGCVADARTALAEEAVISIPVFGRYQPPWQALGIDTPAEPLHDQDPALEVLAGWLLTAAAVSFGAPFWFDLMQRLSGYRRPLDGRS